MMIVENLGPLSKTGFFVAFLALIVLIVLSIVGYFIQKKKLEQKGTLSVCLGLLFSSLLFVNLYSHAHWKVLDGELDLFSEPTLLKSQTYIAHPFSTRVPTKEIKAVKDGKIRSLEDLLKESGKDIEVEYRW